jgi:hypothetical protein
MLFPYSDYTNKQLADCCKHIGAYMPNSMLSIAVDSKTIKGQKQGYLTGIVYLIPDNELCPASKLAACQEPCLVSAGRGRFSSVHNGRLNKTVIFKKNPMLFYELVKRDIIKLKRKAEKQGMAYCVRLNGTSDIAHHDFIKCFPSVTFYDYTKRISNIEQAKGIDNYHLTFSYSGANPRYLKHVEQAISLGANIATVFSGKLPNMFLGLPVISGDDTDLRFLDSEQCPSQCIVGLTAKGKAKKDASGFVVQSDIIAMG